MPTAKCMNFATENNQRQHLVYFVQVVGELYYMDAQYLYDQMLSLNGVEIHRKLKMCVHS